MILGIIAWVYRVVWRDGWARGARYTVASVDTSGPITTVEMSPVRRPLRHAPGRFVFVRIGRGALAEPHPFTIASAPHEPRLRLHVKHLGDWSEGVASRLSVGESVRVEGPYGRLELHPGDGRTTVWVAGGVGITPFLGASAELPAGCEPPHLFYAVRSRAEAVGLEELEAAAAAGRIRLHVHPSAENCRLCAADLEGTFGPAGLRDAHVVMCGPDALVRDMTRAVRRLGARRVHVEAFDIRTGVGPDLSREANGLVDGIRRRMASRRRVVA
jgi:predicted ferric reductase